MKLEFSEQIFEKASNVKFNQYLFSGSRVVPCERTDMTKLIVDFRNFANAPKKERNRWLFFFDKNGHYSLEADV
jgi:hypothetical protein